MSALPACVEVEWHQGGIRDSLGERDAMAGALEERDPDHDSMTYDQGWQLALLDLCDRRGDAHALLGEGLAAGEDEGGVAL